MDIFDLVASFSSKTEVPIEPNEVKQSILSGGLDLTIRFIGVELDTDVLRGKLSQYVKPAPPYGEDTNIADVYYATNQSSAWIRLVCIKEMTHILDAAGLRTSTNEELLRLVERMALSPEFENLTVERKEGGPKVIVDKLAVLYACAIAFPWQVRELLLPYVQSGKLNEDDVVRLVDIPVKYVRLVMSDQWPTIHSVMRLSWRDASL